jgi:hypothetical protein
MHLLSLRGMNTCHLVKSSLSHGAKALETVAQILLTIECHSTKGRASLMLLETLSLQSISVRQSYKTSSLAKNTNSMLKPVTLSDTQVTLIRSQFWLQSFQMHRSMSKRLTQEKQSTSHGQLLAKIH